MQIFSAAWRTAGRGSATLPLASLYSSAGARPRVVEVGCFNTNTTGAFTAQLRRTTSLGTPGTATIIPVSQSEDDATVTSQIDPYDTHTSAPSFLGGAIRTGGISTTSGIIWTFQEPGLIMPSSATSGLAIVSASGSGRVSDVSFTWIE